MNKDNVDNNNSNLNEARLESLLRIINYNATNIQDFLDYALAEVIDLTSSAIGYIYLYNEDTEEFTLNSWSKEVMPQCNVIEPQTIYQLNKTGFWGEAVRQRKPVMLNNFSAPHPHKKGIPEGHVSLNRFLTIPVMIENSIVAVVGVANKIDEYTNSDIRQLTLMMDSVWKVVERKKAEEILKESERNLKKSQKIAHIGSWSWNVISNEIKWTDELYAMYGFDPALPPPPFQEHQKLFTPDSWVTLSSSIDTIMKDGSSYELELETVKKDGSNGWMWVRGEAEFDSEGKITRLWGAAQDITERKISAEKIKENEKRYRGLLNNMDIGVVIHRPDTSISMSNPRAGELLGLSPDQMKGKEAIDPQWKFISEDNNPLPLNEYPVNRILSSKKPFKGQILGVLRPKTNDIIWLEGNGFPVLNDNGEIVEMLINFMDITKRKKIEEELIKVQKLDALGLLAGGIAHDFNNIMGGIFGYIELANSKATDPKINLYLDKALSVIERAKGLTMQLLTFAKGGTPIKQVGTLFPFIKETTQFALSGSNVTSQFNVPADLWPCDFDKNQIGQVIDNMVINAKQAMPSGGTLEFVATNITLAKNQNVSLPSGKYVALSIKDYGTGIPHQAIHKIFDPFYTTKTQGHGLGLATCYSIVKRHGGSITCTSDLGIGTTFTIILPAYSGSAELINNSSTTEHKGSGTFLIMDDEEVIRESIGGMLTYFGYDVVYKEDGASAVEFVTSEIKAGRHIAGMIFDLTVPNGMGGEEAIKKIRAITTEPTAFVSSGYSEDPVMANPNEYGFAASILKPFRMSELSELLNTYCISKK